MKYLNIFLHNRLKTLYSYLLILITSFALISCDGIDVVDDSSGSVGGGGGGGGGSSSKTGSRPILSVNPIIALEGSSATFELRLSKAAGEAISISYSTGAVSPKFIHSKMHQLSDADLHILSEKTASSSDDYVAASGTIVFLEGETVKTVSISLTDDANTNEGIESFALRLATSSTVLSNSSNVEGVAYIVDKDVTTSNESKIYFPARVMATENQSSVKIPFIIYPALVSSASLSYATTSVDATDAATAGADYTSIGSGVKNLVSGQDSGEFVISLADDTIYEGDEQFALNIFSSSVQLDQEAGAGSDIVANSIIIPVVIRDDEEKPYLIIEAQTLVEASSTMVAATVKLSWPSEKDISVNYQTQNFTAMSGEDYLPVPLTTLNFLGSSTLSTKNINVVLLSDNKKEENEKFILRFFSAVNVDLKNSEAVVVSTLDKDIIIQDQSASSIVSLVSSQIRVNESGSAQQIRLMLNKAASTDQVVTYSLVDFGANPATSADYSIGSLTATISAGQTSANIPITFLSDADTIDEQVQLRLTGVVGGATLGSLNASVITISGDSQVSASVISADRVLTLAESVGSKTVGIALSAAASTTVTVYYTIVSGSAGSADYTDAGTGSVSMAAGVTSANITLNIVNDTKDEVDEQFSVLITNVEGAVRDAANITSVITITDDDDDALVEFSTGTSQLAEADSIHFLSLTLPESEKDITLNYVLTGTATSGLDYTDLGGGSVFIPAGQTAAKINLQLKQDSVYEPNETIVVTLSAPAANLGSLKVHTVTIEEASAKPQVSFESSTITVVESAGILKIPVVLSKASSQDVTVTYAVSVDGLDPAAQAADYTSTASSLTITAGSTRAFISISITEDIESELNEQFKVTLSSPSGADLGSQTAITSSIYDDDGVPQLSLSAATDSVYEGELISITVNLTGATKQAIQLNYTVVAAATNPASTADYAVPSGVLTIPVGASSATISLQTTEDTLDEENEKLTLTLTSVDYATFGGQTTAEITILDDDSAPSVNLVSSTLSVTEGSASSLAVSVSAVSGKDITVNYTLTGSGANPASGTDYTDGVSPSGAITILAGVTSANIIVNTTNDSVDEEDEAFTVALGTPVNATVGAPSVSVVTIQDNDSFPVASVDSTSKTCTEGNSGNATCNIPISLSTVSSKTITVNYTLSAGTATLTTDYADAASGSVSIAAGATTANIAVNVVGDTLDEVNETFTVTLSSATNAVVHATNKVTTATITDDDAATVSVGNSLKTCVEGHSGNRVCNIPISLNTVSSKSITVNYNLAAGSTNPASSSDYADAASGSVSIAAGVITANIAVNVVGDVTDEEDETFTVTLSSATNAVVHATNKVTTATITDDDLSPTISVVNDGFVANQICIETNSNSICNVPVVLERASEKDITVQYLLKNIDNSVIPEGASPDFSSLRTFVISAGVTTFNIPVTIIGDSLDEDSEEFLVELNSADNAIVHTTPHITRVVITDDDAAPVVSVSSTTKTCVEADSGTVCNIPVSLSAVSGKAVTVSYALSAGTATLTTDFADAASGSVSIAAGHTTANITVNIVGDRDDEVHETFTATISSPTNASLGTNIATLVTITDNDLPEVGFTVTTQSIAEGDSGTKLVTLVVEANTAFYVNDIVIPYTVNSISTTPGVDYIQTSGTLTFRVGSFITQKTITVTINGDTEIEPDEEFKVMLFKPTGAEFKFSSAGDEQVITITNED